MLGLIMKIINSELCFYVFNLKIYVIFKGFVCYFYIQFCIDLEKFCDQIICLKNFLLMKLKLIYKKISQNIVLNSVGVLYMYIKYRGIFIRVMKVEKVFLFFFLVLGWWYS